MTSARQKTIPVIDFEKNESLKGIDYLDMIYHAVVSKQVLRMKYRSFKARSASSFLFYPYLLKEYRNRWFVFGVKQGTSVLVNLALDRIHSLEIAKEESYRENTVFDPVTFFDDLVGVTKNTGSRAEVVRFWVDRLNAPYVETKPLHKSQRVVERQKDGSIVFEIEVVINQELRREICGFAEGIRVLSPPMLVQQMVSKFQQANDLYRQN